MDVVRKQITGAWDGRRGANIISNIIWYGYAKHGCKAIPAYFPLVLDRTPMFSVYSRRHGKPFKHEVKVRLSERPLFA